MSVDLHISLAHFLSKILSLLASRERMHIGPCLPNKSTSACQCGIGIARCDVNGSDAGMKEDTMAVCGNGAKNGPIGETSADNLYEPQLQLQLKSSNSILPATLWGDRGYLARINHYRTGRRSVSCL